jgi:hypothetical protein
MINTIDVETQPVLRVIVLRVEGDLLLVLVYSVHVPDTLTNTPIHTPIQQQVTSYTEHDAQ